MGELERDLRAMLDGLAAGAAPSDDLVNTTVERSVQIRRHRRIFGASAIAAVVLAVTVTVASIAGAGTGSTPVRVTNPGLGPGVSDTSSTTTTTTPVSPTTGVTANTIRPGPKRGTTVSTPDSAVPTTTTTTTTPACAPPESTPAADPLARSGEQYTTLPNGDIKVGFGAHPFGPARETYIYVLDDGTVHEAGFDKIYAPDQFGTHWFDLHYVLGGTPSCPERVTFTVGPEPTSTTTTIPPTSTTIPVTTTTGGS